MGRAPAFPQASGLDPRMTLLQQTSHNIRMSPWTQNGTQASHAKGCFSAQRSDCIHRGAALRFGSSSTGYLCQGGLRSCHQLLQHLMPLSTPCDQWIPPPPPSTMTRRPDSLGKTICASHTQGAKSSSALDCFCYHAYTMGVLARTCVKQNHICWALGEEDAASISTPIAGATAAIALDAASCPRAP